MEQAPSALQELELGLLAWRRANESAELLRQLHQDENVHHAEQHQKRRGHRTPDDASHARERVEVPGRRARRRGHGNGRDDDDGRVAERKERADGDGFLARGDEAARHEVDAGDVVCVEGMAETEDPGYRCGADELGVRVQHESCDCPGGELDEDEQADYGDRAEGEAFENGGSRVNGFEFLGEFPVGVGFKHGLIAVLIFLWV